MATRRSRGERFDGLREPAQARGRATRDKLLDAGAAAFSELGYAGATHRVIAERAGVSVGTLYQYFVDRGHLLLTLARERAGRASSGVLATLEGHHTGADNVQMETAERVRQVVEKVIALHREDPGLHAVLTSRRHADKAIDEVMSASERALVEGIGALLKRLGHRGDVRPLAFVLFAMVEGAVHAHVLGDAILEDDQLISTVVDSVVTLAIPGSG